MLRDNAFGGDSLPRGEQTLTIISEPGVNSVIMLRRYRKGRASNAPAAKKPR